MNAEKRWLIVGAYILVVGTYILVVGAYNQDVGAYILVVGAYNQDVGTFLPSILDPFVTFDQTQVHQIIHFLSLLTISFLC